MSNDAHTPAATATQAADIGRRIRERRLTLGLSQAQVAGERYTRAHVSRVEKGLNAPSSRTLTFFADRLGVSPEFLLTGIDPDERRWVELGVARGERRLADRDWDEAAAAFTTVLTSEEAQRYPELAARARVGAATAHCGASNPKAALAALESDPSWERHSDPSLVARGLYALGWAYVQSADWQRGARLLDRALPLAEDAQDHALAARILSTLAFADQALNNLTSAERHLARARDLADDTDPLTRGRSLMAASVVAERKGNVHGAIELAQQGIGAFSAGRLPEQTARLHIQLARLQLALGRPEEADREFDAAEAVPAALLLDRDRVLLIAGRAQVRLALGDIAGAEGQVATAERLAEDARVLDARADVGLIRARLELARGDTHAAVEEAERALDAAQAHDPPLRTELHLVAIDALKAAGQLEDALEWSQRLINQLRPRVGTDAVPAP